MARLIDVDKADVDSIRCYYGDHCYLEDVQEWIDDQPTVDAVPVVHGEWNIGKFNAGSETVFIECSECAAVFDVPTFVFGLNYNYCPNCGADMRGVEDG